MVLMAVTAYLYSYSTLGDAVTSGNLALAEKRLNWNLEGLGPNDGLIVKVGSLGLHRYPLLRMVVRNRDSDMRELLLKHGRLLFSASFIFPLRFMYTLLDE